ncbi:hypothetical protein V6N12_028625 [Hibiscus sabdariffa]|uniref:DUF4283 domain-containing protein n=1 Tax=Hibiscus sabdariffa TaxID=183260 RepID=A0ABR2F6B4_9ROSI
MKNRVWFLHHLSNGNLQLKIISSKLIDDLAVVRASQGIWKKEMVVSISILKPNYLHIKFPDEDTMNDILSRGPWTFKDEWLALTPFVPNFSIDVYTFNFMMHGFASIAFHPS